jgi:hypothetical protein
MLFKRADRARKSAEAKPGVKAVHVFPGKTQPRPPVGKKRNTRTDFLIGASGIALGLTCALFPWYIFFNQEQFGPPKVTFAGAEVEAAGGGTMASPVMQRGDSDVRIVGMTGLNLDYTPTGSLPPDMSGPAPSVPDQPFPDEGTPFKVLHVTAGRAMIEDNSGIWVVQRGSDLPDRTRVERIERQGEKWVLVTSDRRVLAGAD